MDLDHRRAQPCRHLDLLRVGGDEQRHPDAGIVEPRDEGRQRIVLADHVQPALGGEFFAPLGHQAHRVGLCRERNPQHVLGRRHLEIQRLRYFGLEAGHVAVADMAAVLAQMRGDAVGAGLDRGQRGAHRIRPLAAPRVAQGGAFSRAMSLSRMWRRSSRRCAVMPSAPASIAASAARTGSGRSPPRALRRVAT